MGHGGRDFLRHIVSTRSVSMKGLGTCRRVPLFAATFVAEISRSKRNRFRGYIAARLLHSTASSSPSPRPLMLPRRDKTHQSDRTRSLTNTRSTRRPTFRFSHVLGIRFSLYRKKHPFLFIFSFLASYMTNNSNNFETTKH